MRHKNRAQRDAVAFQSFPPPGRPAAIPQLQPPGNPFPTLLTLKKNAHLLSLGLVLQRQLEQGGGERRVGDQRQGRSGAEDSFFWGGGENEEG